MKKNCVHVDNFREQNRDFRCYAGSFRECSHGECGRDTLSVRCRYKIAPGDMGEYRCSNQAAKDEAIVELTTLAKLEDL